MSKESAAPLSVRIRGYLPDLQPAMRRVGEIVVSDPSRVAAMPITTLAAEANTSETTVIRFCREIGVSGYTQLRIELATEMGARTRDLAMQVEMGDILPDDDFASVVRKISYADTCSVTDTAELLSISELEAVVAKVVEADRILIFGVGASGLVGMDFQQKLYRIGLTAFAFTDPHQAAGAAGLATSGTVAFGFSHTGKTRDTVQPLLTAKENGAATVGVTNSPNSLLAQTADRTLLTAARETTFRSGATGSRLAQLTVVDCLFVAIAQQTFDQSIRALESTRVAVKELRDGQGRK